MSESFAQLFEESLKQLDFQVGSILPATIVKIEKDYITVDAGYKSEGVIPVEEFLNEEGEL